MKIAIIGPGAMGLLFGGYLSQHHDVTLVGRNKENMTSIENNGIIIRENDGTENVFHPYATADSKDMAPADLVILFTKANASQIALEENKSLIGKETILMTLQNGVGHENLLKNFASPEQIIIGTTQQGSYKLSDTSICHSGGGDTILGTITGDYARFQAVTEAFSSCGFPCMITPNVKYNIWNKIMINASSSVLSGVLQTTQGYVVQNTDAWAIAEKLICEICMVATADGYPFDEKEQLERIKNHLLNAPNGYTSIYADLKAGRMTEVSVINGAVVDAGRRLGIPIPTHELMVSLVHAMENRKQ